MKRSSSPRLRYGGSKVRTGCVTCKARRVKCDEGKPFCQRCCKSERVCGGYTSLPKSGRKSLGGGLIIVNYVSALQLTSAAGRSVSPRSMPYVDRQEQHSLEYFRTYTAKDLAGSFPSELWSRLLLQVSVHEPAIRHAVIALGALHECFVTRPGIRAANSTFAMQQYGKAIREIVKVDAVESDLAADTTLLTCILFTAFESLCGHYKSALTHLNGGITVLHEHKRKGKQPSYVAPDVLNLLFIRLHTQSIEIGDVKMRPAYAPPPMDLPLPTTFTSLTDALVHMDLYLYQYSTILSGPDVFDPACDTPLTFPDAYSLAQEYAQTASLMQPYQEWCAAFDRFIANNPDATGVHASQATRRGLMILQVWRILINLFLRVDFRSGEMDWDKYLDDFKQLVTLAASFDSQVVVSAQAGSARPTFSLNLGIIAPLYCTGSRCRDSHTRRRALKILQTCRRKEGVWDSSISAKVLERLIAVEEGSARAAAAAIVATHPISAEINSDVLDAEGLTADQVPEESRIVLLATAFGAGRQGLIQYRKSRSLDIVTELVEW